MSSTGRRPPSAGMRTSITWSRTRDLSPRLPHSISAYLTVYRHAGLGYQKGLTLFLVNPGFTGMPFKARKYGNFFVCINIS